MVEGGGYVEGKGLGEFDIIARYFAPLATDSSALSLRDDAAVFARQRASRSYSPVTQSSRACIS